MPETTITMPAWVTTPHDLAAHLMDGPAVELGRQLDDMLDEHRDAVADMEALRDLLIAFGALEPSDTATGLLDLLEVLLPPVMA